MMGIRIIATGRCTPSKVVTNDDLSKIVDTSDEWISTRTGIKQRHFCEEESNSDLAYGAAKKAIEAAGIDKEDIGLLVTGTFTPDNATPSVSCVIKSRLGLPDNIPVFDVNAACSGFLYSLNIAKAMLENSDKKYAVVIGSEKISSRLNMEDRGTCVLFGDGAGAAVIGLDKNKKFVSVLGSLGCAKALGCSMDENNKPHIYMDGKAVFKQAVTRIADVTKDALLKADMTMDDIDYCICHQANERIIKGVITRLKAPEKKFYINIDKYGNTSAASIPIALDEMFEKGLLKPGMKLLLNGFGAGYTWGAIIIEL